MHRPSCWNGEMGGLFCPKLFRIAPCLNYSSKTKLIINISYLKHFVCSSQVRVKCSFQRKTYLLDSRSNSSPIHMYDWAAKRAETSSSWTSCVEARTISLMFACIKKNRNSTEIYTLHSKYNIKLQWEAIFSHQREGFTLLTANAMIISDSLCIIFALPPG